MAGDPIARLRWRCTGGGPTVPPSTEGELASIKKATGSDPVRDRLVASLSRPAGNARA